MSWEDLLLRYGNLFLEEELPDDILISQENLSYNLSRKSTIEAFRLGAFSYGYFGGSFDFGAAYFIEDSAGNYASIEEHQALRYFEQTIYAADFIDWLYENNYIAEWQYIDLRDEIL